MSDKRSDVPVEYKIYNSINSRKVNSFQCNCVFFRMKFHIFINKH